MINRSSFQSKIVLPRIELGFPDYSYSCTVAVVVAHFDTFVPYVTAVGQKAAWRSQTAGLSARLNDLIKVWCPNHWTITLNRKSGSLPLLGIDPSTFSLQSRCSNHLSYRGMCEKGDSNPCACASDLEADSLTTRTFSQVVAFNATGFRYRELNPGLRMESPVC